MKFNSLIKELDSVIIPTTLSPESILKSFNLKLEKFGLTIDEIDVGDKGDIIVNILTPDKEVYPILFMYDIMDGPQALFVSDEKDDEQTVFSLDFLNPSIVTSFYGTYVNLSDLSWLDDKTLIVMLRLAGLPIDLLVKIDCIKRDEFDQVLNPTCEALELNELFKTVIRKGKKIRVPLIRRVKKKRLTARQRMGLKKAARSRKRKSAQIARKRKKSIAIRNRQHIKKTKLPKSKFGYKIA